MSEIADLSARRWNTATEPHQIKPADALRQVARQIEAGEVEADHVIICVGTERDNAVQAQWFQAGSFALYAQLGLLERIKAAMIPTVES